MTISEKQLPLIDGISGVTPAAVDILLLCATAAVTNPTAAVNGSNNKGIATCALCFRQGIYGQDIIEVDYRDRLGRDSTRCECRNNETCLDRRGY